ncbi:MAG: CoA-binding protein [Desulfobulbaceae bacterium]|jgi:predicted CoA-binding protein|nr:CoA-binding protein [Desulfobulbaceae bacterium]MDY0351798.1 CoA-binding protein [Desulfobulbaceae bacterium]
MVQLVSLQKIKEILQQSRRIAVVGLSPKPDRPSHRVAAYLINAGYEVVPVNPGHETILGRPCYPDLKSVPGKVDIADIFRRSEQVMPVVLQAIDKKIPVVWMQQGIVNREAAELAEQQGITVIMDRCIQIDHRNSIG